MSLRADPGCSAVHALSMCVLCRFHEVEPQKDLEQVLPQQVVSQRLLKKNHRVIPYPALSEKTIVLSEVATVGTQDTPDGQLSLMVRWAHQTSCLHMIETQGKANFNHRDTLSKGRRLKRKEMKRCVCCPRQDWRRVPGQYGASEGAHVPVPLE